MGSKILLTEKLTNGVLVTPTPVLWSLCALKSFNWYPSSLQQRSYIAVKMFYSLICVIWVVALSVLPWASKTAFSASSSRFDHLTISVSNCVSCRSWALLARTFLHKTYQFVPPTVLCEPKRPLCCFWRNMQVTKTPESKVHGANMGPTWGRQDPGGSHVGLIKIAIWACFNIVFPITGFPIIKLRRLWDHLIFIITQRSSFGYKEFHGCLI